MLCPGFDDSDGLRKTLFVDEKSIALFGFAGSQVLPALAVTGHDAMAVVIRVLTMIGLAFIMIHVGFEFHIDKARLGEYGKARTLTRSTTRNQPGSTPWRPGAKRPFRLDSPGPSTVCCHGNNFAWPAPV